MEFVSNNWLTLTFVFAILKGLAAITKSDKDDKIISVFANAFSILKNNKGKTNGVAKDTGKRASMVER